MIAALILAGLIWAPLSGPAQRAERPGTVTGQILSSTGAPAGGVRVGLMDAPDFSDSNVMGITQTDAEGRYRFDSVPPGRYYIFAGTLDQPTYFPGATQLSRATVITVGPESAGNANFTLARVTEGSRVSGRVVLHREKPPAKIQGQAMLLNLDLASNIVLGDPGLTAAAGSVNLAEDGAFVFSGVRSGAYLLNVLLGDDVLSGDDLRPAFRSPQTIPIVVFVRDKDITGIEAVIPRFVEVQGIITTEDGNPLPNFDLHFSSKAYSEPALQGMGPSTAVQFIDPAERSRFAQRAAASNVFSPGGSADASLDGTFRLMLQEGEYQLRSIGLPEGYYFKTLAAGSADLLRSPLKISATDTGLRIVAVMARSAARVNVSGRIGGSAGAPLPARISLLGANELTNSSPIRPDGTFSISRVPPGTHAVRLDLASGLQFFSGSVTVSEVDRTELEIAAPPLRAIVGHAALRGEGPLPAFTLIVSSGLTEDVKGLVDLTSGVAASRFMVPDGPGSPWAAAMTIAPLSDGTFRFVVPDGAYQVSVALSGMGAPLFERAVQPAYELESMTFGSVDLAAQPMEVTRDSADLRITLVRPPALSFRVIGRIVGLDASVQREARVKLAGKTQPSLDVPLGADGTFEFPNVPTGKYAAQITPASGTTVMVPVLVTDKDVRMSMVIPPIQEVRGRVVMPSTETREPPRRLTLQLAGKQSNLEVLVEPNRDGTFRARIPEGEFFVNLTDVPEGLAIGRLTSGSEEVNTLLAPQSGNSEFQIVLTPQSAGSGVPPMEGTVSLSGSVIGGNATGPRHLHLEGVAFTSAFDSLIDGGRFRFPDVLPGIYVVSILQDGLATPVTPSVITASAGNRAGREIEFRPLGNGPSNPVEESTGVIVTSMMTADMPFNVLQLPFDDTLAPPTSVSSDESLAVGMLRTINTAEVAFLSTSGGNYGEIPHLIAAGLLDTRFNSVVSGYSFYIVANGGDYVAAAVPADLQSGQHAFFSTPDGVVRFTTAKRWAPSGLAGKPVQ